MVIEYQLDKIENLDKLYSGKLVSIHGRVIGLYYDSFESHAYFTVADPSGMVLVKVVEGNSQTILLGAIVHIRGKIALHDKRVYVTTKDVSKMQTVEDAYTEFAEVPVPKESDIPNLEGKKWVKPFKQEIERLTELSSVTLEKERNINFIGYGIVACIIALFLPIILGVPLFFVGIILMFYTLFTREARVTGYEVLQRKATVA